jgi:hypothetical protein
MNRWVTPVILNSQNVQPAGNQQNKKHLAALFRAVLLFANYFIEKFIIIYIVFIGVIYYYMLFGEYPYQPESK